jgi:hypothetical protein
MRPSKLGSKKRLFTGHPDVIDRAAVLYSLMVSARRRGLGPADYLQDILARLSAIMTKFNALTLLQPATWQPASTS